jgi:DNA-binding NtrC family response regulator
MRHDGRLWRMSRPLKGVVLVPSAYLLVKFAAWVQEWHSKCTLILDCGGTRTEMNEQSLPRILIIDDLFGRTLPHSRNEERANLCGQYLLRDLTNDEIGKGPVQLIKKPVAEVIFHRGQTPNCSSIGDTIHNDLPSVIKLVRDGWRQIGQRTWSMVLLDLCFYTGRVTAESHERFPGMPEGCEGDDDPKRYFGLRILEALHEGFPDLPVIMLSSKPRAEVSREFTGHGALAFLERDGQESPALLRKFIDHHGLIPDPAGEILGYSHLLLKALRSARRASQATKNLLIRGERGTGKELLARYINRQGHAASAKPFCAINSAALTTELFATELFGIERGVATGVEKRSGYIQAAAGGDLFLDEIGDMVPQVQRAILRVLEEHQFTQVGGRQPVPADVRFISATNIDIDYAASTGLFREDLHDRLQEGGVLLLPTLRDRREDIPLLVEQFVRRAETQTVGALKRQIEPEALAILSDYDWPGNIRQLRSCVFNAVANHSDVEHLQPVHLEIPNSRTFVPVTTPKTEVQQTAPLVFSQSIDDLMSALDLVRFETLQPTQYAGKLRLLEAAWARLMTRYLRAGLHATRRLTPNNPEGEYRPLPALQLLTGDDDLKAWQAYDIIKAICQLSPEVKEDVRRDPVLGEIFDRATHSRGRR